MPGVAGSVCVVDSSEANLQAAKIPTLSGMWRGGGELVDMAVFISKQYLGENGITSETNLAKRFLQLQTYWAAIINVSRRILTVSPPGSQR